MEQIAGRLKVLRLAIWHGWTKIIIPGWGLLATYDLILSEVIPEDIAAKWPRPSRYLGMIQWYTWLIVGIGILLIAIFEFAYKKSQEYSELEEKFSRVTLGTQRAIPRTATAPTTITSTDAVIRFDATGGEIIQPLPPVTNLRDGQRLNFHKIDKTNNRIAFILDRADTFAGVPAITLAISGASVTLEANVSYRQWFVNP